MDLKPGVIGALTLIRRSVTSSARDLVNQNTDAVHAGNNWA
jgi:hypothetical protein